jgi:serine/threonine protein kinase
MSLKPGQRLGPYEIQQPLGAGGMGEVYRARDTRLERQVAVKVLPAALTDSEQVRARFEREARTISQLNHSGICTLHDVGNDGGVEYLVMEYLEGESLEARLERGPLPLDEALCHGIQIANALAAAHALRVVHRDLKPANVMITASGAKLLDFGLAKIAQQGVEPARGRPTEIETEARNLTEEATILVTVQYNERVTIPRPQ